MVKMTSGSVTDWLQLLAAGLLIVITARYVSFTKRIMEASLRQAEAANKTAEIAIHQWKSQQLQQLLPIKLALTRAGERIAEYHRKYPRDLSYLKDSLYRADLEAALTLARASSNSIALNLEEGIESLRRADKLFSEVEISSGWEGRHSARIAEANQAVAFAERHFGIAKSWVEPLLSPVESTAYPTDAKVSETAKLLS